MKQEAFYILQNKHKGFDELARELGISKEEVKKTWNKLGLGWHMTPRTLVSFRRIAHDKYEVLSDVVVFIAPATPIVIYRGSILDFASVPGFLHGIIDKDDNDIAIAALAHDILYMTEWVDRKVADGIFLQLMKYRKTPLWKRFLAYRAVRLFGWIVWILHDQEKVEKQRQKLLGAVLRYTNESILNTQPI